MSYCRWSSNNGDCDIYAYESYQGGWDVCVAGNRYVRHRPLPDGKSFAETIAFLDEDMEPIELPHAGETFNEPTLEAFEGRLLYLRNLGYRFPDYVLESIAEEKREAVNAR